MGMNWHYFLGDSQGNCAVLEFIGGEIIVHRGEKLPVPVLFNQTYERDLRALGFYKGFGGEYEVNFDDPRVPRIAKAATMLREFNSSRNNPLEYSKSLLYHVGNKPYKWGIIVDVRRGMIHFNTESCPEWKSFCYRNLDYSNSTPVMTLDLDQQQKGDVGERFRPIQDGEVKASIMQFGLSDEFYSYFHTTREEFAERSATAYHEAEKPERQYFRGIWKGSAPEPDENGEKELLELSLQAAGSSIAGTAKFRNELYPVQHLRLAGKELQLTFRTQKGTVIIADGIFDGDRLRLKVIWTEGILGEFILQRELK
jgi:choloylglycine hydrolase